MPPDKVKKVEAVFIDDPNRDAHDQDYDNQRDLSYFIKTVKHIAGIMRDVFPEVVELNDDETLTYLHSTVSSRRHPVKTPDTPIYLDHILTDQAYQPGEIPVLGNNYVMTATINGFPSEAWPGILDGLNHLALEYRWSSRFICLDNQDAKNEVDKYRKNWFSKRKSLFTLVKEQASGTESRIVDTEAESNAVDAEAALEELGNDVVAYGYYTSTITVWHPDLDICHQRLDTVMQVINSKGFTTRHETTNSFHAWLSSLPGHVYSNVRRPLINTLNVAHIFPLSAIWSG
ncbi:conjugal transfer ATPase TrbE [methanotrophic bacterial endosymbiont of Bathymodiolus sp.]|nr:conjugal transfer ATPase TrbE [methanotrophic bacterial endosymbiont of Bathymodiolus sp.]